MHDVQATAREGYLRTHLEERYDVHVENLQRLDKGVYSINLRDGRRWVARVFPAGRSIAQVEGDAAILWFLEQQGFPAERCADANPITVLYGRGILVTDFIAGSSADSSKLSLSALGALLGRLNLVPVEDGAITREAGALHHYAQNGGDPQNELIAASAFLAEIEDRIPAQNRSLYEFLQKQITDADTCHDLPQALIHPDPVLKNILITENNNPVLIDWTGTGRGPRLASLAVLIWSCALQKGGWSSRRIDAVVAGYRSHIRLEERELVRLAGAMRIRPLTFACWRYRSAIISERLPDGTEWWWPSDELTQAIAARACAAFQK